MAITVYIRLLAFMLPTGIHMLPIHVPNRSFCDTKPRRSCVRSPRLSVKRASYFVLVPWLSFVMCILPNQSAHSRCAVVKCHCHADISVDAMPPIVDQNLNPSLGSIFKTAPERRLRCCHRYRWN